MTSRNARAGLRIATTIIVLAMCAVARGGAYTWQLPRGFPEPAVPADNPMNEAKVALGARLFADPRLSVTGQFSCQSCHVPERAFTDGRARSRGATGESVALNAPTLFNVAYNASFGWNDAGVHSLEQQMRGPLFNEHPPELGLSGRETLVERELAADPQMASAFEAAFPGERPAVSMDNVIRAIAAYERTLIGGESAFDRYVFGGDHGALDAAQKTRHGPVLLAARRLFLLPRRHQLRRALGRSRPAAAKAVFADTGTGKSVRVPTLRNLSATAPYMHDGRFATLGSVLEQYERLASDPAADPRLRRAPLTTAELADLRSFLLSLDQPH
jgi:cytochrome c peroxidase